MLVAAMSVYSIIGRALLSKPLFGDVEITQLGIAASISLCLPWCQLHRGNILVDFFTQSTSVRARQFLDSAGALLLAAMCVLLAWRTTVGAIAVREVSETSMILGLPMWWAYVSLAPGLLLSALVAVWQAALLLVGQEIPEVRSGPVKTPDGLVR
ncbi:MAG: TRAP transporter small permease [Betaproteobacteria bacterium]|nr:TRAP transporter small permease [Betaproteobacteria bacterium]